MKTTIEFPISKRITVAQFKTTTFSIEEKKRFISQLYATYQKC